VKGLTHTPQNLKNLDFADWFNN